jgi:hypothetical protein
MMIETTSATGPRCATNENSVETIFQKKERRSSCEMVPKKPDCKVTRCLTK